MTAPAVLVLLQVFLPVQTVPCTTCYVDARQEAAVGDATVTGTVRDQTGGVIAGAIVIVRSASGAEQQTVTGAEGQFTLAGFASEAFDVIVRAGGFAEFRLSIAPSTPRQDLSIVVLPASKSEEVTVAERG
jgi:hypothetical protein